MAAGFNDMFSEDDDVVWRAAVVVVVTNPWHETTKRKAESINNSDFIVL